MKDSYEIYSLRKYTRIYTIFVLLIPVHNIYIYLFLLENRTIRNLISANRNIFMEIRKFREINIPC